MARARKLALIDASPATPGQRRVFDQTSRLCVSVFPLSARSCHSIRTGVVVGMIVGALAGSYGTRYYLQRGDDGGKDKDKKAE